MKKKMYLIFYYSIYIIIIIIIIYFLLKKKNKYNIRIYKHYIELCKRLIKIYSSEKTVKEHPYFSICIPVYNMEKYLEVSIVSILNQSYRDFEIIIINDNSNDNSIKIIQRLQSENSQIRLINHKQNLGVYKSRVDLIRNARGKYIMFIDPDDIYCNKNLLKELYKYNSKYNLDIIEFSIILNIEKEKKLYYPSDHKTNHFHKYKNKIIFQPELSNILYFSKNKYSSIICRCLWNKMIIKEVFEKSINYLGDKTYNKNHFDFAEDTIFNVLNYEFASNFSNLNLNGYMYNVRYDSMSHSHQKGDEMNLKMANNIFYFYKLFYKYIKYFKKDLNYLFYDLKSFDYYFDYIKNSTSSTDTSKKILIFYKTILQENNISSEFKHYTEKSIKKFSKFDNISII